MAIEPGEIVSGHDQPACEAPERDAMRCIVVVPVPSQRVARRNALRVEQADKAERRPPALHTAEDRLAEAVGLARAIDLEIAQSLLAPLAEPRPSTLIGKGKVEEIGELAKAVGAGLVIIDHALSPIQQRNLEKAWSLKVIDRTGLILEIFGRRAATREGRLQVELAHLSYQKSRLVRSWTHLERQRGGAGFLGGPGESQLELDRRLIQDRIDSLEKDLEQVVRTRELHRKGRARRPYPVVAIVGYTNAGKSTLFNRLTGAHVLAKDQVFATLDPTMRELRLPSGRRVILSDTVGFISDLPTTLVAAFRATLEEVVTADLIMHVRDISHAESAAQRADVLAVLAAIDIDGLETSRRPLEVWNKVDQLEPARRDEADHVAQRGDDKPLLISSVTGEGVVELLAAIDGRLGAADEIVEVTLPPSAGKLAHWLHETCEVLSRTTADNGDTRYRVRVDATRKARLEAQLKRLG